MTATTFDYDPDPNVSNDADQVIFNTEIKNNLGKLNQYALPRYNTWTNSRITPIASPFDLTAKKGAQYVGVILNTLSGAVTLKLPLSGDMLPMNSIFFQDESGTGEQADVNNITLLCQGTAKIYGSGLAAAGVTSVLIDDAGGYKELIYVDVDKYFLIRNSDP